MYCVVSAEPRYNGAPMPLGAGTKLGPYEIQSPLGAGGMGEVYRARDTRLDRTVAIKILPPHLSENPEARQRFDREARSISSLNHPNICTLHDVGHQDGVDYLVMEFVQGETLDARLEKGLFRSNRRWSVACRSAMRSKRLIAPASCTAISNRQTSC
jgi:eukaryotic-like serine/threonine-protein kinase